MKASGCLQYYSTKIEIIWVKPSQSPVKTWVLLYILLPSILRTKAQIVFVGSGVPWERNELYDEKVNNM